MSSRLERPLVREVDWVKVRSLWQQLFGLGRPRRRWPEQNDMIALRTF